MGMRQISFVAVTALALGFAPRPALAQALGGNAKEAAAIVKNAEAFVAAYHKEDAQALAAIWAADGEYTDITGQRLRGRKAIEEAFRGFFAENDGLKLRIDSENLRFLTGDVAIEDGITSVLSPKGGPPSTVRYTIVHVKQDGKWRLGSVRDTPYTPPSNHSHLSGLDWLVGDWVGRADTGEVQRLSFTWTENQSFLVSSFTTTANNISVGGATLWTGWDPVEKKIRTWLFDSTGGFGEGVWSEKGKAWSLATATTLPDGSHAAATYVLTRVDADTLTFQATARGEGGESIPDGKKVRLKRAVQ